MAGLSVFLQFKLADLLTRPAASEWRFYGAPYYRFQLHRALRSRQHNLLKRLAEANRYVHYVAPRFTRVPEFDLYYRQGRVVSESAWVAIARLPWVSDTYPHHITYRTGHDLRFSSPESEPLDQDLSGEGWINQLRSSLEAEHSVLDRAYFERVRAMLVRVLSESRLEPELAGELASSHRKRARTQGNYIPVSHLLWCRDGLGRKAVTVIKAVQITEA